MDTKRIIIDGEEVEIYTTLNKEEIEDNKDLFMEKGLLEDTIDLSKIVDEINSGENNG